MASVNYKVAGFSPSFKSDLGALVKVTDKGARKPNGIDPIAAMRWAYNFDGVDDYAVLDNRAINVDNDIITEFYTPSSKTAAADRFIIAQGTTGSSSTWELALFFTPAGAAAIVVGGAVTQLGLIASDYTESEKLRLEIIGSAFTVYRGATAIKSGSVTRGAARQPAAPTVLFARLNSTSYSAFFAGLCPGFRIGSTSWAMSTRNSATQVSTPAGNTMTLVNTTSDRWQEIPE